MLKSRQSTVNRALDIQLQFSFRHHCIYQVYTLFLPKKMRKNGVFNVVTSLNLIL